MYVASNAHVKHDNLGRFYGEFSGNSLGKNRIGVNQKTPRIVKDQEVERLERPDQP